jgi:hypothetical protein
MAGHGCAFKLAHPKDRMAALPDTRYAPALNSGTST